MWSIWIIFEYIPYMLEGLIWTLTLVGGGLSIGFILGLILAFLEELGGSLSKVCARLYIWFFRGTPLLVLLFLFYWGISPAIGLDALETSIVVLGLRSGAYQSEIFRAGIKAIDDGEILAAEAMGMSSGQVVTSIILPQAIRISLPAWTNEYAILLKDSAICFTLGVAEILTRARYVVIATDTALIPYLFAGLILAVLTVTGVKIINFIYKRIKIPGLIEVYMHG
jgi:polar amino acid transport system permease protein